MNARTNAMKITLAGALGIVVGCGTAGPSKELVDARKLYEDAKRSPAAKYEPDLLLTAEQGLQKAEAAHEDEPGSRVEQHLAYLAQRLAKTAMVKAQIARANEAREKAEQDYIKLSEAELAGRADKLRARTQELSDERAARSQAEEKLADAEQRLRAALDSLKEMAVVKAEQRGLVITLSGAVLFASGQSKLMPIARVELRKVASALKQQDESKKIVVEGHTDSVGPDEVNRKLSQSRADAVRRFLVSEGIDASRIKSVGKGESTPVGDNNTPDGRATNRRVEIIIKG
ncbi:MAG: OmpA family protein [Myxococcota bacterium]